MFAFFDTIISLITTVISFVGNMILTILYVFEFVLDGIVYVFSSIAYLPPWISAFVMASIGFSVVMFLINR